MLVRVSSERREPHAWEQGSLLDALVSIVSGNYHDAMDCIAAAKRGPADSEIAEMQWRRPLSLAEIRERLENLRGTKLFHELDYSKSARCLHQAPGHDLQYQADD